jgi:hypothetical protein
MSIADSLSSSDIEPSESGAVQPHAHKALDAPALPEPDGAMHKVSSFRTLLAPFRAGRLLDINSEKRNFPITSAHLGWQVTALNTRTPVDDSDDDPPEVGALLESISWQNADVPTYPIDRDAFDMIVIHDLNHRHTLDEQLALVRRCAGTPLLVDARIASGQVVDTGRYQGKPVPDAAGTSPDAQADLASTPFMHTEDSLVRMLRDCGFPLVMISRPPHRRDMAFYLALPKNWDAATKGRRSEKRMARRDGVRRS